MSKFAGVLVIVVLAALGGGGIFLATWDLPPPSSTVEKVIADERMPR